MSDLPTSAAEHSGESAHQRWVLVKASRTYDGGAGYTGPSWDAAGLAVPTAPFDTWDGAQEAREALDRVNAVGWRIVAFFTIPEPPWVPHYTDHEVEDAEPALRIALLNTAGAGRFSDRHLLGQIIPAFRRELRRCGYDVAPSGRTEDVSDKYQPGGDDR